MTEINQKKTISEPRGNMISEFKQPHNDIAADQDQSADRKVRYQENADYEAAEGITLAKEGLIDN